MVVLLCVLCGHSLAQAAEPKPEHLRGTLEKTTRRDASAQITDSLGDTYYIAKSEATEKLVRAYVGKPQKVILTGTVEPRTNGTLYFLLKTVAPAESRKP